MKMRVTFKDPDTLIDTLDDTKRELMKTLRSEMGLSERGAEVEAEERMAKMEQLASKFFEWHEYVTIELDDETMTARVVPKGE